MSAKSIASKQNKTSEKSGVGQLFRKTIGWGLGSVLAFLSLIPATIMSVALKPENDIVSLGESAGFFIVGTIVAAIFIALTTAAFRWTGRTAAAHGPLLFGVIFGGVGIRGFFPTVEGGDFLTMSFPIICLGLILCTIGAIYYRRAAADNLPVFGSKKNESRLGSKLTQKLMTSKFGDGLQTPWKRRAVVAVYVMFILTLAGGVITSELSPAVDGDVPLNTISMITSLVVLGLIILVGELLGRVLRVCLRPVSNENLDERQSDLIQSANADSRILMMAAIILIGIVAISPIPSLIAGTIVIAAIILAWATPQFILACTLPAENDMLDDDDDEAFMAEQGLA